MSIVSEGSILSGASVSGSIIGRNTRIHSYSELEDCIIMDNVEIGRNVKLRGVIIDKNVKVPDGERIGFDPEEDKKRFFVSENGIVCIPKQPRMSSLGVINI